MSRSGIAEPMTDERLEQELRATLASITPLHAPASLAAALPAIVQRPARAWPGLPRLAVGLVALAVVAVVVGAGLAPAPDRLLTIAAPVASPSAAPAASPLPSPSPGSIPVGTGTFDWGTDLVHLTADEIVLTADGKQIAVQPHLPATSDPGDPSRRSLEVSWAADGREQLLHLELQSDDTDWWVSTIRMNDDRGADPQPITFEGPLFRTPIGQAFHGDIELESEDGRVPGTITLRNATIDPVGLGSGPHGWEGCTRYEALSRDAQQLLDAAADPRRIEQLGRAENLCRLYFWTTRTATGGSLAETWCTPPPSGSVRKIRQEDGGELLVFVDDLVTHREPRPQPSAGWGCDGSSSGSPAPSAGSALAYDWSGDGVTFTADALVFGAGDMPFIAKVPAGLAPTRRHVAAGVDELRWDWQSDFPNRLVLRVVSDGRTWHVDQIAYQDRAVTDTQIRWTGLPTSGRVGQPWTGDLSLAPKDARGAEGLARLLGVTFDPGITADILQAPPSPTPFPDQPFVIDNGHVRLAADGLELALDGDAHHGPIGTADQIDSSSGPRHDSLRAGWMDDGRFVRIDLEFQRDGKRWWLSDGWISAWGLGSAALDVTGIGGPLGSPFRGDLSQSLPQVDAGSKHRTGEQLQLTIRNLSLEPFRDR